MFRVHALTTRLQQRQRCPANYQCNDFAGYDSVKKQDHQSTLQ